MPSEQNVRDAFWTQKLLSHLIPCHQLWPALCTSKKDEADPGHPGRKFIPNSYWWRMHSGSEGLEIFPWKPKVCSPYSWQLSHQMHRNYKQIEQAGCNPKSLFQKTVANKALKTHAALTNQRAVIVKWYHSWWRGILLWWAKMPLLTNLVDAFPLTVVHCMNWLELSFQFVVKASDSYSL